MKTPANDDEYTRTTVERAPPLTGTMPPSSNTAELYRQFLYQINRDFEIHKDYYEALVVGTNDKNNARFAHLMGLIEAQGMRITDLHAESAVDLRRVYENITTRFDNVDKATLLVDQKNALSLRSIEQDVVSITATYARTEVLDKAVQLARDNVMVQFEALEREKAQVAMTTREKFTSMEAAYTRLSEQSRERIGVVQEHLAVQSTNQTNASKLSADTTTLRFEGIEKATTLANASLEKRLESMNEFRNQLREQTARFQTREEVDTKLATSSALLTLAIGRITELEKYRANGEGKLWAFGVGVTIIVTLIEVLLGVGLHFLK